MRNISFSLVAACLALWMSGCEKGGGDNAEAPSSQPAAKKKAPEAKKKAPEAKKKAPEAKKEAPAGTSVHFVFPSEGSKVFEDFDAVFGGANIKVSPAGTPATIASPRMVGHHHIVVDGKPIPKGTAVPADATHIHYGKAQTATRLKLAPGKHTLTMQFADSNHISFGAPLSSTVNIEVVANPAKPPRVYFEGLTDGAKISSPLKLKFGLDGMTIQPAGKDPASKTTGHHHLIIDGVPTPVGTGVAADATHIHFGKGQTETEVTLTKGKHTLTLQFADGAHRSYGKALSSTVTVEVQ